MAWPRLGLAAGVCERWLVGVSFGESKAGEETVVLGVLVEVPL